MSLPALSLRQPWAWLVLHGKSVENRSWKTSFRGWFLIHAAKGMTGNEYFDAMAVQAHAAPELTLPDPQHLLRGGIVGIAQLVNIIPPEEHPSHPWRFRLQYGWELEGIRALPFLPCAGTHKLWSTEKLRVMHPTWDGWEIADAREKDSRPASG